MTRIPREITTTPAFRGLTQVVFMGKIIKVINSGDKKSIQILSFAKGDIPEKERCVVCFGRTKREHLLVPCGHTQICHECSKKVTKCPLCQKDIANVIKIY